MKANKQPKHNPYPNQKPREDHPHKQHPGHSENPEKDRWRNPQR